MGHQMVRPMHEKSRGKIVQQNRQDAVARLLFSQTFSTNCIASFFLVTSSSLAIPVVHVLKNERESFICQP